MKISMSFITEGNNFFFHFLSPPTPLKLVMISKLQNSALINLCLHQIPRYTYKYIWEFYPVHSIYATYIDKKY